MAFSLGPRAKSAGYRLAAFDSIGSTNAEALSRARDGERGPIWFVTSRQTADAGGGIAPGSRRVVTSPAAFCRSSRCRRRSPRRWICRRACAGGRVAKVSVEASLRSAGSDHMKFSLKWPNDVLAGGQKLAGILLEAEAVANDRLAVVVGIGTNVVAAPEGTPTPQPRWRRWASTSARRSCSRPCRMHGPNCAVYGMTAADLARSGGSGWSARPAWAKGHGPERRFHREGTFDTLDESGCMVIRTSDGGRVPISAGDVYFGAAASAGAV